MHDYRITYRSFNRTTKRLGRHRVTARGMNRWGALRAWWAIERQWHNPVVEVVSVEALHTDCPRAATPWGWEYTCRFFPHAA